jgi:hypothetical protein
MIWTDEPATWKQLRFLKQSGYQANGRLTKSEAAELIMKFPDAPPELHRPVSAVQAHINAHRLRLAVQEAARIAAQDQRESAQIELRRTKTQRQEFWLDTCRGSAHTNSSGAQILELYRKYGCVFCEPTQQQVQDILDALDAAMPLWDKDHPELFFEALRLNFPALLKHSPRL